MERIDKPAQEKRMMYKMVNKWTHKNTKSA